MRRPDQQRAGQQSQGGEAAQRSASRATVASQVLAAGSTASLKS
jgi:hypothetical protein